MNILMPMAGLGTRMNCNTPKHLIPVAGHPMFLQALHTFLPAGDYQYIFVVREEHLAMTQPWAEHLNATWVTVPDVTSGPAATAWAAREMIPEHQPLWMLNCDQMFQWDAKLRFQDMAKYSAGVFTFTSTDPKCSYVKMQDGCAVEFAEKQVISTSALTGVHYWQQGRYFLDSCEQMLQDDVRVNGEHYISMSYNYLVQKMCVGEVLTQPEETILLGTAQELMNYETGTFK